jgi:hypothetical protein
MVFTRQPGEATPAFGDPMLNAPGSLNAPLAAELAGILEIMIRADAAFADFVNRCYAPKAETGPPLAGGT